MDFNTANATVAYEVQ